MEIICHLPFSDMRADLHTIGAAVIACSLAILLPPVSTRAASVPYVDGGYIGQIQLYKVKKNDSLIEVARYFNVGYNSIVDANPGVDPFLPKPGDTITIPTAWIPPFTSVRPTIVINLPEYRLYYFPDDASGEVLTFPLGIGDEGKDTPTGTYSIVEKIRNPAWRVPESIRSGNRRLPRIVPPGPENPMGPPALRLSRSAILIHGTNRPWGIGRRSSHGCLRLYPEDIVQLFRLVEKGTEVAVINEPIKVSISEGKVFIEVHRYGREGGTVGQALHLLAKKNLVAKTDFKRLIKAVEEKMGVPTEITLKR